MLCIFPKYFQESVDRTIEVSTSLHDYHCPVGHTYLSICCDILCQSVLHQVMTHEGRCSYPRILVHIHHFTFALPDSWVS